MIFKTDQHFHYQQVFLPEFEALFQAIAKVKQIGAKHMQDPINSPPALKLCHISRDVFPKD